VESRDCLRDKLVSPVIVDIAKEVKSVVSRCPVCGYDVLWLKEVRREPNLDNCRDAKTGFTVLYKCGRCAYVNTTNRVTVVVDGLFTFPNCSYEHFSTEPVMVKIGGEVVPYTGYSYIGRDFWNIPDVKLPDIRCYCGSEVEITNINPFYRNRFGGEDQYRCDITCRCSSGHLLAFGVHISKEDYEKLLEVKV